MKLGKRTARAKATSCESGVCDRRVLPAGRESALRMIRRRETHLLSLAVSMFSFMMMPCVINNLISVLTESRNFTIIKKQIGHDFWFVSNVYLLFANCDA